MATVVGAGEHDVGADGARGDGQAGLVRVRQTGDDDRAAGAHVDGRSRRGVPDGDPGLAGRDGGDVVDERRQRRAAVRVRWATTVALAPAGTATPLADEQRGGPSRRRRRPGRAARS